MFELPRAASRLLNYELDSNSRSVKLRETKTIENFVVAGTLITQDPNRDLLAEFQRFVSITPPVNARHIPAIRNIRSDLVQFTADSQITRSAVRVRNQIQTIIRRFERSQTDINQTRRFVEPRLENRDARTGYSCVTGAVSRMCGRAL